MKFITVVRIRDNALVSAAVLSDRYISDRFLPDKAIDLMDEAAAKVRLKNSKYSYKYFTIRTKNSRFEKS